MLGLWSPLEVSGNRDRRILLVAGRQHTCIARSQLLALGVSDAAARTLLARGWLTRRYPGVYRAGPATDDAFADVAAALLALGGADGAAVAAAGATAARIWSVPASAAERRPTILLADGRRSRREGIAVVRTRIWHPRSDLRIRDGLPVTSPARTLCDLAAALDERALGRALDDVLIRRLCSERELEAMLDRAPRRAGAPALRRLLDRETAPAFTRSGGERRLRELIREAGLPEPRCNVLLHGFEVDCYWPAHGLVVELDSRPFHTRHRAFERDHRKDQVLRGHGLQPLRITGSQLAHEPLAVVALITRGLTDAKRAAGR